MSTKQQTGGASDHSIFAPLKQKTFCSMWVGSTVSNTGGLIQSVTAAWVMAGISTADHVALVQTATLLPMAIFALPAGAIADIYDRRKVQMLFLSVSLVAAALLMLFSFLDLITPWVLLGFCFLVGSGNALFAPARGASVGEQVPKELLAQAVALNNISFNLARSVGPAVGGLIVSVLGASVAFAVNAFTYVPMLVSLSRWRRTAEVSRLPPEGLFRSISAGLRYVVNMQPVRRAMLRAFLICFLGAALQSLLPLVARDLLNGDAKIFGLLLGAFGIGAVSGIFVLQPLRVKIGNEYTLRCCCVVLAVSLAVLSVSSLLLLDLVFLFLAGMAWMITTTSITVTVQLFVPRWVMGRTIATTAAAIALGVALGSWLWGAVAESAGLAFAYQLSAVALLISLVAGRFLPLADRTSSTEVDEVVGHDPEVELSISGRSGPICIELQYRVGSEKARDFYNLMREVQRLRSRTGAYDWSLSRNLADPQLWSERFRCPTWDDYLRLRNRRTLDDRDLIARSRSLHIGIEPVKVLRWLDRPSGSVRWSEEVPDHGNISLPLEN